VEWFTFSLSIMNSIIEISKILSNYVQSFLNYIKVT